MSKVPRRRASPEIRARAAALRESGATMEAITAQLGWSYGAVSYWLLRDAVEAPRLSHNAFQRPLPTHKRGKVTVHAFTEAEDEIVLAMARDGATRADIARALTTRFPGRPRRHNTITMRLMTLARREERLLAVSESASIQAPQARAA